MFDLSAGKADHQLPGGLLKPLGIPEWKWECVACDFVSGLPSRQADEVGASDSPEIEPDSRAVGTTIHG